MAPRRSNRTIAGPHGYPLPQGLERVAKANGFSQHVDRSDQAERWLGWPLIAINTATYWHALRANGIDDKVPGFGRLMMNF